MFIVILRNKALLSLYSELYKIVDVGKLTNGKEAFILEV